MCQMGVIRGVVDATNWMHQVLLSVFGVVPFETQQAIKNKCHVNALVCSIFFDIVLSTWSAIPCKTIDLCI